MSIILLHLRLPISALLGILKWHINHLGSISLPPGICNAGRTISWSPKGRSGSMAPQLHLTHKWLKAGKEITLPYQ